MYSAVLAVQETPLNIDGGWPIIFMFHIFWPHILLFAGTNVLFVHTVAFCRALLPVKYAFFTVCRRILVSPFAVCCDILWAAHGCHSVTQVRSGQVRSPQFIAHFYSLLLQDSLNVPSVSWSPACIVRDTYGSVLTL